MGVKNARPVTLRNAKLVSMASEKATKGIATNAIKVVMTVLLNLTRVAGGIFHKLA